jgi:hypothetical protein
VFAGGARPWADSSTVAHHNRWKKLINRGDVFAIVAHSAVWNDALKTTFNKFN